MKPVAPYPLHRLESLIRCELERKQFVLPLSIRCEVKQRNLLIVLDYAAVKPVETALDVESIQLALSRFEKVWPHVLRQATVQAVRCYWRQQGQQKPEKGCSFQVQYGRGGSNVDTLKRKHQTFWENMLNVQPLSWAPWQNRGELKGWYWGLKDWHWGLKDWHWGVGIGLTMVCAVVGVGTYAWSRPCMSRECIILETAQALQSSLIFEGNGSVEDVAHTYSSLLEMNYQLSQVPFWSPHYEAVKDLLSTYETHTHQVSQVLGAEEHATVASAASQSPPYPLHDWQAAQEHWQAAIQTLEPVSQDTIVSPLAQTQLQEYNTKLQAIEQKMEQEQMALNRVQSARKFAQIAEMNSSSSISSEQLKQVESSWQKALEHLTEVSDQTMAYAEAQHLRALYEPQLLAVRDRLSLETLAEESYRQAIAVAKQSTTFEQEQQWSLAVTHWQQALEHIHQVPEHTTYQQQVVPLVTAYTTALANAQDHLQEAVALQKAADELARRCNALPTVCETVTSDDVLHVQLATNPNKTVDSVVSTPVLSAFPGPSDLTSIAALPEAQHQGTFEAETFNEWFKNISSVGKTMQVSIKVYTPDGNVFGTYNPQTSSFVRTAAPVEKPTVDQPSEPAVTAIAPDQL